MNTMLGSQLKKLRLFNKLTQEKLVEDFNAKYHYNLTKSAISQYENNKRLPTIGILIDFADYFNVSIDFLLGKTPQKHKHEDINIIEENVSNYIIEEPQEPFKIDNYLQQYREAVDNASRVVIFSKTATKRQINIINACIKIGLELAKDDADAT